MKTLLSMAALAGLAAASLAPAHAAPAPLAQQPGLALQHDGLVQKADWHDWHRREHLRHEAWLHHHRWERWHHGFASRYGHDRYYR